MDYTGGVFDSSFAVHVFGDQTNAFESDLSQLLHVKDCELLSSFFEKVNYALRLEISRLPASQKAIFPRFTSVIDLLARYSESENNPALGLALLCLNQCARFINYYARGSAVYPSPNESCVIGLCTGSLAAAAVSCSQNVFEFLPAAREAVLVAFRTGLRSIEVRDDLKQDASSSWSVIVALHESQAIELLNAYAATKGCSQAAQPYLSAVTPSSVTISGAPNILEDLLSTAPFANVKPVHLSVHAPYHASHLYDSNDVDRILASSDMAVLKSYSAKIPLVSCTTGKVVTASDYDSLLRVLLGDILVEQLRWDNVLKNTAKDLALADMPYNCTIFPVLTNAHCSQSLSSTFSQTFGENVKVDLSLSGSTMQSNAQPMGRTERAKIAIVGFSGRFPDAESDEKFWELLHKGLDVHREVPPDRWDVKAHFDPTGQIRNTSKVQHGCWIKEPGLFDARFFNMSPKEAAQADPAQRLAVVTAYEAMEMSGFVADRTPSSQRDRIGLFYGTTSDDWREVNSGQDVSTYFIPGGNRAFIPGRINYHFKFSGPSFSIDTACSSSFAALHTACNSLWTKDCDMAIAGGTNILSNPDNHAGLDRGHFLSTTGNCKPFDDSADGYCRADSVGSVILKRLEDAEADKDPIFGVLLGAYTNHSAESDSMTRPHAGAQAFIFNKMLKTANVSPLDISYIEMHGTGTQTGDAVEMKSVLEVFAKKPRGSHSLHLGSVKANVGHAESASGITALIKVLKMMEHNEIPPHVGIKTKINHGFPTDLKARNVNIALEPTHWPRPSTGKRTVFMNNFSAAGGNTALLMEDAPLRKRLDGTKDPRSCHVVAISGKSNTTVQNNIKAMLKHIENTPDLSLPALSYTTTARRMHHNFRVAATGNDLLSIRKSLQDMIGKDLKPVPAKTPKVAFVFTGQGSMYVGMAQQLFDNIASFRGDIQRFDRIAQRQGFPSILTLIKDNSISLDTLGPVITQLGTMCIQMALAKLWASWGLIPSVVIGHSLGEYAALHVAGVISASDAIFLTGTRAQMLVQHCSAGTHSMLAVKSSLASIIPHMAGTACEIACINSGATVVVSGTISEIDALSAKLSPCGIKSVKLEVPFAFHSAQVEPILDGFETAARGAVFNKPSISYISPLLKSVVTDENTLNASYLSEACRKTVNFVGGLEAARADGTINEKTLWVEIGSHPVCSEMIKAAFGAQTIAVPLLRRNTDTWKIAAESVSTLHRSGIEIKWNEYHRDFEASHQVLKLPAYSWDNKRHWIQYQHNFCLTKGAPPVPTITAPPQCLSVLSTTSVQRVIDQSFGNDRSTILAESDLSEPLLYQLIQSHKVNDVALCPSSLWADVAITLGDHLLKESDKNSSSISIAVSKMLVEKPLIATGKGPQLYRASASANWKTMQAEVHIYSVTQQGKKIADHATCVLHYENSNQWLQGWKRTDYLIQSRIKALRNEGVDVHKIKRGLAYKLFSGFVEYGQRFQGMEEVLLDSSQLEATAKVKFQTTKKDGEFLFSPYWIDSLGHLAGFIMNSGIETSDKNQVFVNHGWDNMRCATKFSPEKIYRTYVRMINIGGAMHSGDVYIFDEDTVVGVYEGVKFQGIPRQVIDQLLPSPKKFSPAAKPVASGTVRQQACKPASTPVQKAIESVPKPPKTNLPQPNNRLSRILEIVAEEIGLSISELTPSSDFTDFGVDSLMSLTITGRFREELDLDCSSSLFTDQPTVKELCDFLGSGDDFTASSSVPSTLSSRTASIRGDDCLSEISGYETEQTDVEFEDLGVLSIISSVLAEEIGVSVQELEKCFDFSELGLDSLMSLTVLGRLREELDLDLPSTLFSENNSLGEVIAALGLNGANTPATTISEPVLNSAAVQPPSQSKIPRATSIFLQGSCKTASKTLFLFPDGSGSSTSYAPLPNISSDVVVYGLNCPYQHTPDKFQCSLEDLTAPYLEEIRRRQPHGPYYFGGWSAGGICAFDAAQELERCGEIVERLILIDSPFPIGLEKLPPRLYDFFGSIGMFGSKEGKQAPKWLIPHFLAFVDSLDKYRVKPFALGRGPKTHIVWAKDGVCKNFGDPRPEPRADDPREMKWLLNNRIDFGTNGWGALLGRDDVVIETMEEANHFTMMEGKKVAELARFIGRAMA